MLVPYAEKNYSLWTEFIKTIKDVSYAIRDDDQDELHRLLLNYLTTAYTISEHFEGSINKRARSDKTLAVQYDKFVGGLCAKYKSYAFFSDYRNHVQHQGLAAEHYARTVSGKTVVVTVSTRPSALIKEQRNWKKSGLTSESPPVDLISSLEDYHRVLLSDYVKYVIHTFFPGLFPAANFFAGLTAEAQAGDRSAKMFFATEQMKVERHGGHAATGTLNWVQVPNDLFSELGIQIKA